MDPRYRIHPSIGRGFSIRDHDDFGWEVALCDDEANARRICNLLNDEHRFQSQEEPVEEGRRLIAVMNEGD
jgi:hypothetical protein